MVDLHLATSHPLPCMGGGQGRGPPFSPLQLAYKSQQFFEIGQATFENVCATDDPLAIDDEDRPLASSALGSPEAVGPRDRAVWEEIGQERIGQPADRIGEGVVRRDMIDANAQDLDTGLLEAHAQALQIDQFVPSTTGPVEDVEGEHNIALPAILREGDRPARCRREGEVGRFLPDFRGLLLGHVVVSRYYIDLTSGPHHNHHARTLLYRILRKHTEYYLFVYVP